MKPEILKLLVKFDWLRIRAMVSNWETEVLERCKAADRSSHSSPEDIEGELIVDAEPNGPREIGTFWWDKLEHRMSATLWRLARCLWSRFGERVSFEEIIKQVWGDDAPVQESTVKRRIAELGEWFLKKGIPLTTETKSAHAILKSTS